MRTLPFVFVLAAASQIGATDCGQITRDPGFDLWCGDSLCSWKLERGSVQRVATWHDGDSGVELVGADSAIEQFTPVNSGDGTCIEFDLVSNVDENAEVYLNVDIYGDGTDEMMERLPASRWKLLSYKIAMTAPYTGVRFELAKRGSGNAVVARMNARIVDAADCDGLTPLDGGPAPNGGMCTANTDCASNLCVVIADPNAVFGVAERCEGCDPQMPACAADEVCGVGDPTAGALAVPRECEPTASRELGEQCGAAAECASNLCIAGVCSACDPGASACTGGFSCAQAYDLGPYVCGAGSHGVPSGQPCATDDECASERCNGSVRMQCAADGRPCGNSSSCPVDEHLVPTACDTVGVQGGSCQ